MLAVKKKLSVSSSSWPSPKNSQNLPPTHRTIIMFSLTSPFLLFSLIRKHRPTHNSEGSMLVEGILSYTRNRRHHETKKPDVAFDDVLIQRELNMMGIWSLELERRNGTYLLRFCMYIQILVLFSFIYPWKGKDSAILHSVFYLFYIIHKLHDKILHRPTDILPPASLWISLDTINIWSIHTPYLSSIK